MRYLLLLPLLLSLAPAGRAQTDTVPLTLSEVITRATANGVQVKKARLERRALDARVAEARSAAWPDVRAVTQFDVFPWIASPQLPGAALGAATDGPFVALPLGQPWQLTAAVTAEQPLFDPVAKRGAAALDATRAVHDLLAGRAEDEVAFTAATTFYQALQTREMLRTVEANRRKVNELHRIAQLQYENDYATRTDVKRLRVAQTNLEAQRANLLAGIDVLQQTLGLLVGLPAGTSVLPIPTDTLAPGADSLRWLTLTPSVAASKEQQLLERQIEINRVQAYSARAAGLPRASAYAAVAGQLFTPRAGVFDTGDRPVYGVAVVGLRAEVPLFRGFHARAKAALLDIEREKAEADLAALAPAKALEFRQAQGQVRVALLQLRAQADNVDLAREVLEKTGLQYRENTLGLSDVVNAQTALAEAETNYGQQVYTYRLAVLKLLKAAGRVEELY